jgi:glycosyltransferase involved in cell wall biosynthesis
MAKFGEEDLPLVSVITPCYRQAHFLNATLKSVFSQSYPALESIVINDGSDDDTEAVARQFGDKVRYIWQTNAGLSAARNTGIAAARGKYLLFLDSDDILHPDAVSWLIEAANPRENVLCVMRYKFFEHEGEFVSPRRWLVSEDCFGSHRLLFDNLGPPHCFLSTASMVIAAGGFDPSLKSCEDWDLWLRLLFNGAEIHPVCKVGAYYRQHPTSMSKNPLRMAQTRCEVLLRTYRHLESHSDFFVRQGLDSRTAFKALRNGILEELLGAAYFARQEGSYLRALHYYYLSMRQAGLNGKSLRGVFKLFPHWVLRSFLACDQ